MDSFDDRSPTPDRVPVRRPFSGQPDSFDDRSPTPKRQDRHEHSFQDSADQDLIPDSFEMPAQEPELPWSSDFGFIDFGPDEKPSPYDTTAQIASSGSQVLGSDAPLTTPETSPAEVGKTYTLTPQEIISLKAAVKDLDQGLVATNKLLQATNEALQATNKALKTANKVTEKAMRKMKKQIDEIERVATLEAANVEIQTARIDSNEYMMQRTRRKMSKVKIDGEIVNLDETSSESESDFD
jgi:hypothetical protein